MSDRNIPALTKSCEHTELRRAKTGGWFCADRIDCEFTIPEPGLGLLETVRDALRHGGRATRERAAVLVDEAMSARLRAPGPVTSKQQLVTELRKLHADIVECDEGRESPMMTLVRRAADALESSPETTARRFYSVGNPCGVCASGIISSRGGHLVCANCGWYPPGSWTSNTTSDAAKSPDGALSEVAGPYTADNGHSNGVAADDTRQASGDDELTVKFPRAWAPYLQAVILGALGDMDGEGDCRWHLNELAKFLGRSSEKSGGEPA